MITARDLDKRLTYREISSQGVALFTHSELVSSTTDLHTLLVQEGFTATYDPIDSEYMQDIWLQVAPANSGILRVIVRYDGLIYTDRSDIQSPSRYGYTVQTLLDTLRGMATRQQVKEYCSTCYYCDEGAQHCGMGRPLTGSDCSDYVSRTQP
jgi:hypothetical protein